MKSLTNLVIIALITVFIVQRPLFESMLDYFIHVGQFLLLIYVIYIMFLDFFKTIRKKLGERFVFQVKKLKRKWYKMKRA